MLRACGSFTSVKVKILTGNYTLQANRQKYNQHEASPICKLCNLKPEDREHFIRRCPILETKRKFYLHQLFELLREHSKEQLLNTVREGQEKNNAMHYRLYQSYAQSRCEERTRSNKWNRGNYQKFEVWSTEL